MTNPPLTGPEAVAYALQHLDLQALESEQREVINQRKKTARPRAVRLLRIIEGLNRNSMAPADLMITQVPVIPPQFRPFSMTGSTFLPGDANEGYRDLMEMIRLHKRSEKEFGQAGANDVYKDVQAATRFLYGYGESPNPKTRARSVKGFFETVTGTSPKSSFLQSRMLAKPVDTVGRGVIIPDADMDMNEVGLPEAMAWKLYSNYAQRSLVRGGMSPSGALKHVMDRSPQARLALDAELKDRPAVISRSPAWHKFSVVGQTPRIVEGDAIRINNYISEGTNADFDGNCVIGSTRLMVKLVGNMTEEKGVRLLGGGSLRLAEDIKMKAIADNYVIVEMPISQIPVKPLAPLKDRNGANVFQIEDGVQTLTNIPDRQGVRWETVTHLTVEHGCEIVQLRTTSGRSVGITTNESVPVPDGLGGLLKVTPADAVGQLMPVTLAYPAEGNYGDLEWGWVLGAFLSDGWWSDKYVGYSKVDVAKRLRFMRGFCRSTGFAEKAVRYYEDQHVAENNGGISGKSKKLHFSTGSLKNAHAIYLRDQCYDGASMLRRGDSQRACLFKKMPNNLWEMSEQMLLGVLSGLFDGDGSLSISKGKSKPQVMASISTSAPQLRDGIVELLRLLGIRSSYTVVKPKKGRAQRHDNYMITICIPDLSKRADCLRLTSKNEALELLKNSQGMKDDRDVVPVPRVFLRNLLALTPSVLNVVNVASVKVLLSRWRKYPYISATRAKAHAWLSAYLASEGVKDEAFNAASSYANSSDLMWERVQSITTQPSEPVYDVVLPIAKVYVISNGLVIYDTMSVHVPSSPEAVKDVKERLMADKMLWSSKNRGATLANPKHESVAGLNMASDPGGKSHKFATEEEAHAAIESGAVNLNDDIEITDTI